MPRDLTAAYELIRRFEGIADGDPETVTLDPYTCPAGVASIGYGHAIRDGHGLQLTGKMGLAMAKLIYPNGITKEDAETLLRHDVARVAAGVEGILRVPLSDGRFCALVSFAYNAGLGKLSGSTLLRLVNAQRWLEVPAQFARWIHAIDPVSGRQVELRGLIRRRAAESALWDASP